MYAIDDKESIVKDIQKFLKLISDERDDVGYASNEINGIFDDSTKAAVIYYQENNGLNNNGIVDNETYYAIYNDYLYHNEFISKREKYPIDITFPIGYGASHKDILKISTMLYDVSEYYFGASDIRKNSYFSQNTEVAVIELREVFGLDDSNLIDEEFYLILSEEYFLINQYKENSDLAF